MPAYAGDAFTVGVDDAQIPQRMQTFHPAKQGRPHVETETSVIGDDVLNDALKIHDAGIVVGAVALTVNALVPVVVGRRGGFRVDRLGPRVLPGRLIKMAVDDEISGHGWASKKG